MLKKRLVVVVLLLSVTLLQANPQQGLTENDLDAKIAYWNKQKDAGDLKDALEELADIMKNPKPNLHRPTPTLADFIMSKDAPLEYDYLIAGGGTTGLVMANRLSEAQNNQVLVIEQGGEPGKISKIPALSPYCCLSNFADKESLEPQPNAGLVLKNGRVVTCKGIGLGGTTTVNSMEVSKGHSSDFTSWVEGWCFDDILKYFQKSETANITGKVQPAYHGYDGPLRSSNAYKSPIADAFISCGLEKGQKEIDYTGDFTEGFSRVSVVTNKGKRQSNADAYLETIRERPNLTIILHGKVIKILIDENKKAYGLQYAKNGQIYTVHARKEVILCLGTFESPVLLMNSGIGPKKDLQKLGIKCIQDLPVGKNMHDQYKYLGIGLFANSSAPATLGDVINDKTKKQYLEGVGPLTNPNNIEAVAYKSINSQNPNVIFRLENQYWAIDKGVALRKTVGISDDFYRKYFKVLEGKHMFSIVPILKAKSKGQVKLRSNNPFDKPLLFGNYYSHPQDKKNMVDAIKFILHLIKCVSFKKFVQFYNASIPGCETKRDDEYWECAIKYLTVSNQAFTGTCKMGPAVDPTSVVDPNLQVIGIQGLRVVDSSVIPGCVTGPIRSIATMIAEKAADLVKAKDGLVVKKFCGNVSKLII